MCSYIVCVGISLMSFGLKLMKSGKNALITTLLHDNAGPYVVAVTILLKTLNWLYYFQLLAMQNTYRCSVVLIDDIWSSRYKDIGVNSWTVSKDATFHRHDIHILPKSGNE